MRAVLFDLDNTLYPEVEFVKSGFKAVAAYLGRRNELDETAVFEEMFDILGREGRGEVFDRFLTHHGLFSEERVKLLVYLYRSHRPSIRLDGDVLPVLRKIRSKGVQTGVVTDGMASVQRQKLEVLGIKDLMDVIVCTDELGGDCWKPSVVPFKVALELLGVSSTEAAYVGDDITKDFVGPNGIGMCTIQITRHRAIHFAVGAPPKGGDSMIKVERMKDILPLVEESGHDDREALDQNWGT
jgi:putative hydrolase of the HAD superfamily